MFTDYSFSIDVTEIRNSSNVFWNMGRRIKEVEHYWIPERTDCAESQLKVVIITTLLTRKSITFCIVNLMMTRTIDAFTASSDSILSLGNTSFEIIVNYHPICIWIQSIICFPQSKHSISCPQNIKSP